MKNQLIDLLDHVGRIERELVGGLTLEERTESGSTNSWSAKDLIAHVTAWQQHSVQGVLAGGSPETYQTVEAIDHANALIYEAYRELSWAEVLDFADRARGALRDIIGRAQERDLTDPERFEWLEGQPLWRRVVGNAVLHPVLHYAQSFADRGDKAKALRMQEEIGERLLALDESPIWQGTTKYNLACAYALAGWREPALSMLREGLSLNPGLREWSRQDPDFLTLRDDPEFVALTGEGGDVQGSPLRG